MLNLKITKLIGSGSEGFTYNAIYNDITCIAKVYRTHNAVNAVNASNASNAKSNNFNKEIEFCEVIKDHKSFMQMLAYLYGSCDCEKFVETPWLNKSAVKSLNAMKNCNIIIYTPLLHMNLDTYILKYKTVPKALLDTVYDGIEYIHKRNYIHMDLHGKNIMCDKHGHWKIIDYGEVVQSTHQLLRSRDYAFFTMFITINRQIIWNALHDCDIKIGGPWGVIWHAIHDDRIVLTYLDKKIVDIFNKCRGCKKSEILTVFNKHGKSFEQSFGKIVYKGFTNIKVSLANIVRDLMETLLCTVYPYWYLETLCCKLKVDVHKIKLIIEHPYKARILHIIKNIFKLA